MFEQKSIVPFFRPFMGFLFSPTLIGNLL